MYKEILEKVTLHSEPKFADWLKPLLSINDSSKEIVIGVRVPILRKLAKTYQNIDYKTLQQLLNSNIHEIKELAIFIMLLKNKKESKKMCELYLKNLDKINNWDLIDYSAPHIIAPNLTDDELRKLANSDYLWANRVAMVSCIYFIKQHNFSLTLEFAKKFITHPHHLMHKASGWMLREVGKKDANILLEFLAEHEKNMPAIMKSYAKEKLN